ncbi:MAG: hypothetical protein ABSC54_02790 [Smithellaceae bacterium]
MEEIYFFVDESGVDQATSLLLVGLVILDNPQLIRDRIEALKQDILHDPYVRTIPSVMESLDRVGFHYSADSLEVRRLFIDFMSMQTFQAYIIFIDKDKLDNHQCNIKNLHKRLIQKVLFDRLMDHKNKIIHISIEKPYKDTMSITGLINDTVSEINKKTKVDIISPVIKYPGKEEKCCSLPDYVCGIFRAHYLRLENAENFEKRDFRRIVAKIRVIHDYVNDIFYTRRNPFPH